MDVFTGEIVESNVAVKDGLIAGVSRSYRGKKEIDLGGRYLAPGYIDAHLHLESTMVTPNELVCTAAKHGTTTFIVDPHEAANVSGAAGIDYILNQTEKSPANVYVMMPSCVPSTSVDDNGCVFSANDMYPYVRNPRVLGLGEVTITRYETKLIQDTTYDTMMKLMDKNAMFALESLEANKEKFKNRERYEKIENNIKMIILKFTLSYLNDQEIEAKYVDYDTEKIENGYKNIDVQLIKDLIYYISKKCNNLYKVKLMKLLWYIDNLYYNQYGKAMTGLVYTHQKMGALPIGNEEIMKFNCIKVEEIINENSDEVLVGYHIKPNEDYEFKGLKKDQKKIVDEVLKKFENYTTKNIVEYMHEEKAYKDTKYNEIIDYSYSKFIKI